MFASAALVAFVITHAQLPPPVVLPNGPIPCIVTWNQSPNGPGSGKMNPYEGMWIFGGTTEEQPGFAQPFGFRMYTRNGVLHLLADVGGIMGTEINTPRSPGRGKAFTLTAFTQAPFMAEFTAQKPPSSIAGWCGTGTLVITITHP